MKAIILPLVLLLVGVGSGVGAGLFLAPPPEEEATDCTCAAQVDLASDTATPVTGNTDLEFVKLNNQFIIPVVEDGLVASLVVMSLNLEVTTGSRTAIFAAEPKLRDRFLQVMFDHANSGGFSGNFTNGTNMRILRNDLLRAAKDVSGNSVTDVLILDIVRQDAS